MDAMKRNIKLLALFNFFTDLRFYSAVLVIYFQKVTGSFTAAMSLFSVVYVASAFFEIPTGIFSDKIGRKKTIMLGALSSVLYAIFYAFGNSYSILLIGAIFEGLSRSWYSGNNDAFLHNSLSQLGKKEEYDHYLGRLSSMFQIALMIAAIIGAVIANWSFKLVMEISIVPQIVCFLLTLKMIEPRILENKTSNVFSHLHLSALNLWRNKTLRLLSFNSILGFGVGESTFQFRSAFIQTLWPTWALGIDKMLSFLGATISFWYSGKILRKIKPYTLRIINDFYSRGINILSTLFPTILSPFLMSTTSLFYGVGSVAESKLLQEQYTEEQRATLDSLNSLLGSLFFGVFSVFIGFIADKTSPATALLISQIFVLPQVLVNISLKRKYEN